MILPWSRRVAGLLNSRPEPRRRSRGRRARREETLLDDHQGSKQRVHQRLSWALAAVLILVVVGVLAAGYYQEFYRPPRVWAGQVRGVQFTMGDLVQRIRMEQGLTGSVNLSTRPFDYLRELLNAEVLRQESPRLGITVTEEQIDQALRSPAIGFYPTVPAGQQTDPGQLDREFQNNYQNFLTRTGLSEEDYRELIEAQLRQIELYFILGRDITETIEQVEVEWIRLDREGQISAAAVMERLQIEEFASVAQSVGVPVGFADASGYVGWVPRQAFPKLGPLLFGDQTTGQPGLPVGEIGGPVFTRDAIYILHKLSGTEERPLSGNIRDKVNFELVEEWQAEQIKRGSEAGWLKMKINSKLYSWVLDQVLLSAPRN